MVQTSEMSTAVEMSTCLADRAWLTRRYVSDRASIRDIAAELGCSTYPVAQALIRHGIPRRARGDRARDAGQQVAYRQLGNREFLLCRYVTDRMTIQQIADLVVACRGCVRRWLTTRFRSGGWAGGLRCRWTRTGWPGGT